MHQGYKAVWYNFLIYHIWRCGTLLILLVYLSWSYERQYSFIILQCYFDASNTPSPISQNRIMHSKHVYNFISLNTVKHGAMVVYNTPSS